MVKNFFKNHPIHKKIVPFFDYFFLVNPLSFLIYWIIVCIGIYFPLLSVDSSPLFLTDFNYKFTFLFLGLSMLIAIINLKKQACYKNIFQNNITQFINMEYINKIMGILLFFSLFFLILVSWVNLILGLFLVGISFYLLNNKSKNSYLLFFVEFCIGMLLFINGYAYSITLVEYQFPSIGNYLLLFSYIIFYVSILMTFEILFDSNRAFVLKENKVFVLMVFLLCFCLGISFYLNDPLLSICICTSMPFFIYAVLRHMKKDFQRAFFYPLFLINFFTVTIFPILAIPCLVLFWIGKYYNWHRFDYHFPTFLVDND